MLFTIIIPIFNREKTLSYCLDSIKSQEYSDFECLLIDDGSVDASLAISNKYAEKDSRFRVFHKENGGVGSARNLGLDNAKGDWIVFVDSDDMILPNHLSQFAAAIEIHGTNQLIDMFFCGCQYCCNGKRVRDDHKYINKEYVGREQIKTFLAKTDVLQYMYICDRIYRRELLEKHKIRFDTTLTLSEDHLLCYQYLKYINGIATTPEATYIINEDNNNKLSKKTLTSEMCTNRYHKLSVAMQELVSEYEIYDDKILPFWKYNYDLLKGMFYSLFNIKENIFSNIKRQQKYYSVYFDSDFYNNIKEIPDVKSFMSNREASRIVGKHFFLFDMHILYNYILFKLHLKNI